MGHSVQWLNHFKIQANTKFSSPIELDASTTKYKSSLKLSGHPDPKKSLYFIHF